MKKSFVLSAALLIAVPALADHHGEHSHDEHAHDEHAHDEHAHDEHAHDEHAHDKHEHDEHDHDKHEHDEHAHDEHAHDEHAHDEHAHDEHAHDEHDHDEHDHGEHAHGEHEHGEHDHHEHGAVGEHVHGHITLGLAQMGEEVQIELTAPLNALVDFEHEPKTDAEQSALNNAVAALAAPVLPKGCELEGQAGEFVALAGGHGEWLHTWQFHCHDEVTELNAQATVATLEAVEHIDFFWLTDAGQGELHVDDAGHIHW